MAKKQKYYVIWEGKVPGIYTSWKNVRYKSLDFPHQSSNLLTQELKQNLHLLEIIPNL
jgi:hypothetical protein